MRTRSWSSVRQGALLLLVTGLAVASRAGNAHAIDNPFKHLVDEARRELDRAKDQLKTAEQRLRDARSQLERAAAAESAKSGFLARCQKSLNDATHALNDAASLRSALEKQAGERLADLKGLKDDVDRIGKELAALRDRMWNMKLMAYSFTTTLTLDFSPTAANYLFDLDVGFGIKMDNKELESLLAGQWKMPSIHPVEAAIEAAGFRYRQANNYEGFRKEMFEQYGPGNVYVASERFVNWAGPEKIVEGGVKGVITGGAGAKDAAQEALYMLEMEYDDLVTWLSLQAQSEAEARALEVLEIALSHKQLSRTDILAHTGQVNFSYTAEPKGATEIPAALLKKAGLKESQLMAKGDLPHLAFIVAIRRDRNDRGVFRRAVQRLERGRKDASTLNFWDAVKSRGGPALKQLAQLASASESPVAAVQSQISRHLSAILGVRAEDVQQAIGGNSPIIDLRKTAFAERLEGMFQQIAIGNEKSVDVVKLEYDLAADRFRAVVTLRNRHSWGTVAQAAEEVGKALKGVSVTALDFADDASRDAAHRLEERQDAAAKAVQAASRKVVECENQLKGAIERLSAATKGYGQADASVRAAQRELGEALNQVRSARNAVASAGELQKSATRAVESAQKKLQNALDKLRHWVPPVSIPTHIHPPKVKVKRPW